MNKLNKLFAGFAAVAMLASCSNDEPEVPGNIIPEGEKAYMTVNIQSTGDLSRSTTIGGYEYGDDQEHLVSNAHFFFFDKNGVYVGRTNPTNPTWGGNNGQNIEWIGKNVIVLEDLKSDQFPEYMLTVLNCPGDFRPVAGQSVEEVTTALAQFGNRGNFVMSTSAYFAGDDNHDKFPMLTHLVQGNFSLEPVPAEPQNQVNVYVERLAAKVTVTLDSKTLKPAEGTEDLYAIDATVLGIDDDNNLGLGNTQLYVRLEGWTLNALAKNSYIAKQLKDGWKTTAPFAGWDKASDYRSFWAKAWTYDAAKYADKNNEAYFDYIDYDTATKTLYTGNENYNYCNENTNVAANILKDGKVVPAYATHVTVAATVCDKDGNGLDLVEYNGALFTKADYVKYALSVLQSDGETYWTKTQEDGKVPAVDEAGNPILNEDGSQKMVDGKVDVWTELGPDSYTWDAANNGTGTIYIALDNAKVAADAKLYKGKKGDETSFKAANTALLTYQKANFGKAVGFNKGRQVYNIPIEHFANNGNDALEVTDEGYYGVVRNHYYKLSIGKILRVGHGIFNPGSDKEPGEKIIPDDPEDPRFYVAATINILSWKVISQDGIELK